DSATPVHPARKDEVLRLERRAIVVDPSSDPESPAESRGNGVQDGRGRDPVWDRASAADRYRPAVGPDLGRARLFGGSGLRAGVPTLVWHRTKHVACNTTRRIAPTRLTCPPHPCPER